MQVILKKQIRKLGKVGDIVKVADGYGRNYLLPQGFAIRATNDNIAKFEANKHALEIRNKEEKILAEKNVEKVKDQTLIFVMQSASDGRLFGSVSSKLIAKHICDLSGLELNYTNIALQAPIKFNGVYTVQVILHPEVTTEILVSIAKTESEAEQAINDHKKGSKAKQENDYDEGAI